MMMEAEELLEEISDTATTENDKEDNIVTIVSDVDDDNDVDDEPEEGEISDDGEKRDSDHSPRLYPALNYPRHFPPYDEPDVMIERTVQPLSSEVVIYDDLGRTAIFTSPNKGNDNWSMAHYENYKEGRRKSRSDLLCSRKSSCNYRDDEKPKRSKEDRKSKRKPRHKRKSSPEKERRVKHRSPSSGTDSVCSSCCSCYSGSSSSSSSNSDVCVLAPKKSRGKENRQLSPVDRRQTASTGSSHFQSYMDSHHKRETTVRKSSSHHNVVDVEKSHISSRNLTRSHSPPHRKEVTRQSPPIYGRMKHSRPSRSPGRSLHFESREPKVTSKNVRNRSRNRNEKDKTVKDSTAKRKALAAGTLRKEKKVTKLTKAEVVDLVLGDKKARPPPGSLGEMLLKKTKKGKLKIGRKMNASSQNCSPKKSMSPVMVKIDVGSEKSGMAAVVGEEEDMSILTDVVTVDLDQEDEDELQLRLVALQSSLKILNDVRREGQVGTSQGASSDARDVIINSDVPFVVCSTQSTGGNSLKKISQFEDTLLQHIFKRDAAGEFREFKGSPLDCKGELSYGNKQVHEALREDVQAFSENVATNLVRDPSSSLKEDEELSDSNQGIIDMEICDSSPEEESFANIVDDLQEVGEDITLDDDILLAGHSSDKNVSQDGYQPNNFQIPVEWAYMMPPPPPPDQPDNDIININSWCFDQNMYLQSMQSTSCNSSEQTATYNSAQQPNLNWSHNSSIGCYNKGDDQAREVVEQAGSIFCLDQSCENDQDLTSGLLNLPKNSTLLPGNAKDESKEAKDESQYGEKESLKDQAAYQYQAFMNAMLQNRNSQTQAGAKNFERNLVEVTLVKSPNSKLPEQFVGSEKSPQNVKITNNGRTLVKVPVSKSLVLSAERLEKHKRVEKQKHARAAARKRRKERKRLEKQKTKMLLTQSESSGGIQAESQINLDLASPNQEEEDEDLLRAQLLIDMSRKKIQKEEEMLTSASMKRTEALVTAKIVAKQGGLSVGTVGKRSDQIESSHPCSISSSAESSPKIRVSSGLPMQQRKVLHRTNNQGSPTLTRRVDPRNLSDIGGFGLDPKNSRYDFTVLHDLNVRKDVPKFQFPPIKPVIIDMNSDTSDDEDTEGKAEIGSSSKSDSSSSACTANGSSGAFMSSLDSLLKCMRAKSTPNDPSLGSKYEGPKSTTASNLVHSTPNAVRHLSRTKQVEYHWLKEQLREKERLHRKRMLQQKTTAVIKKVKEAVVSSGIDELRPPAVSSPCHSQDSIEPNEEGSPATEARSEGDDRTLSKGREVSMQEKGMIQIQLSNPTESPVARTVVNEEAAAKSPILEASAKSPVPEAVAKSPMSEAMAKSHTPSDDEDDEEALRLLVLQTIPKKAAVEQLSEETRETSKDKLVEDPEGKKVSIQNTQLPNHSLKDAFGQRTLTEVRTVSANGDNSVSGDEKRMVVGERRGKDVHETTGDVKDVMKEPQKWASDEKNVNDRKAVGNETLNFGKQKKYVSRKGIFNYVKKEMALTNGTEIIKSDDYNRELKISKEIGKSTYADQSDEKLSSCLVLENSPEEKQYVEDLGKQSDFSNSETSEIRESKTLDSTSCSMLTTHSKTKKNSKGPVTKDKSPMLNNYQVEVQKPFAMNHAEVQKLYEKNPTGGSLSSDDDVPSCGNVVPSIKVASAKVNGLNKKVTATKSENLADARGKKRAELIEKKMSDVKKLEHLKKEYIKQRIHTNEVMQKLEVLIQEATDEERKRQVLKQNIAKLQLQLADMETQYEEQSENLKTKMERIRNLQSQITKDRQLTKQLEAKGEILGKQVLGSNFTLPKVFDSPKRKQTLANNISALRQQIRDACNKSKATLQAAATMSAKVKANSRAQMVGKQVQRKAEEGPSAVELNPKGNNKNAVKNLFQDGDSHQSPPVAIVPAAAASVDSAKRKVLSTGGHVVKKLAKNLNGKGFPVKVEPLAEAVMARDENAEMNMLQGGGSGAESHAAVLALDGRKKIDEMNELCPYDLLGRCNDDSCTYQHLGQPRMKRPASVPATSVGSCLKSAKTESKTNSKDRTINHSESSASSCGQSIPYKCSELSSEAVTTAENGSTVQGVTEQVTSQDSEEDIKKPASPKRSLSNCDESKLVGVSTSALVHTKKSSSIETNDDEMLGSLMIGPGVLDADCLAEGQNSLATETSVVDSANREDVKVLRERATFDDNQSSQSEGYPEGACDSTHSPSEANYMERTSESARNVEQLGDVPNFLENDYSGDGAACRDAETVSVSEQEGKESLSIVSGCLLETDADDAMGTSELKETVSVNEDQARTADSLQVSVSGGSSFEGWNENQDCNTTDSNQLPSESEVVDNTAECSKAGVKTNIAMTKTVEDMGSKDSQELHVDYEKESSDCTLAGIPDYTVDDSNIMKEGETIGREVTNGRDEPSCVEDKDAPAAESDRPSREFCDKLSEANESLSSCDLIEKESKNHLPSELDDDDDDDTDRTSELLDSQSDLSLADVEQCDSSVTTTSRRVGVRKSGQAPRRRQGRSATSAVCRRGRSRTSSSASSCAGGEGASPSPGKASKKGSTRRQVNSRVRKARGRHGGRRGAK